MEKPEENVNQSLEGEISLWNTRKAGMAGPEPLRVNKMAAFGRIARGGTKAEAGEPDSRLAQTSLQELNGLTVVNNAFPRWLGCVPGGDVKACLGICLLKYRDHSVYKTGTTNSGRSLHSTRTDGFSLKNTSHGGEMRKPPAVRLTEAGLLF